MKKVDKAFLNETKRKIEEKLRRAEEAYGDVASYVQGGILTEEKMLLLRKNPELEEYIRDFKSLRSSISISGMMDVVYGLPRLRLMSVNSTIDATFLMLSGIKVNAQKKKEEACKQSDLKYLELERSMALYIDDDLKIKPEFLTEFVNLYSKYLKTFFIEKEVDLKGEKRFRGYVSLPIIVYTIYRERSVMLSFKGITEAASLFNTLLDSGFTVGGAVRMTVRNLLQAKDESLFIIIVPDEEEEKEPVRVNKKERTQTVRKESPLDKYMENGRVVASCPLEEFSAILEQADLTDNLKHEYYAQMRNFNNRKSKEELESELARMRAEILFEEEVELYNRGKLVPEASGIIDDIDTAFLLLHEGVTPDEKDDLIEEINVLLESLGEMLAPQEPKCEEEETPNLVYYLEENAMNGEIVKMPYLLSTIRRCRKDDNKTISLEITKLLKGNTVRDRELTGDEFPCRVFYKGKDMKLFYSLIGGTIVVIDAFKGDTAFKKAKKVVTSASFRSFINEIQEFINSGGNPKAANYTGLVMSELKKYQEDKKIKFTPIDVNKTN